VLEEGSDYAAAGSLNRQHHDHLRHHHHHRHHESVEGIGCGTALTFEHKLDMAERMVRWKEKNRDRNLLDSSSVNFSDLTPSTRNYTVPVNFYVFVPDEQGTTETIPYEQLQVFVDKLNVGFRNEPFLPAPFTFVLHTAFEVVDAAYAACLNELDFKSIFRRGGVDTLNVYFCDSYNMAKSRGGWTEYPAVTAASYNRYKDGIVIMNPEVDDYRVMYQTIQQSLIHEVRALSVLAVCTMT